MRLTSILSPFLPTTAALGLLAGCDSADTLVPQEQDVTLNFSAVVGTVSFDCGSTYSNVGVGLNDWQISDFRLFVHDVSLIDTASGNRYDVDLLQDGAWQASNVALLDFEDGCGAGTVETNTSVRGGITIPPGESIDTGNIRACFTLGVPENLNHLDPVTAPSPLNSPGMLWAWKIGMKYLRIDGVADPLGASTGYNLHLGAQGCTGPAPDQPPTSACTIPNTVQVCIDSFDLVNDRVAVDPKAVMAATNIAVDLAMPPGCQSFTTDQDCITVMPKLGLDYTFDDGAGSVVSVGAEAQALFRKD